MEKWTMIGRGNDSTVYVSEHKQHVMKIYDGLMAGSDPKDCFKILNKYSNDTLLAQEVLDTKLTRRGFSFGSKNYELKITMLPQGDIAVMMPENVDESPRQGLNQYVVAVGQRYIECDTFGKIVDDYNLNQGNSVFHNSINSFEASMKRSLNDIQELLQKNLGLDIIIGKINVKPLLDKDNNLVDLVITDFADCLPMIYHN